MTTRTVARHVEAYTIKVVSDGREVRTTAQDCSTAAHVFGFGLPPLGVGFGFGRGRLNP